MNIQNGQLQLLDLVSRAYLHQKDESSLLVSGVQAMPTQMDDSLLVLSLISIVGGSLYPFALSILLPVYMFTIVLEKEERLQEMMKMNGMQMKYYWIINYFFFIMLYVVAVSLFYLFGYYVLDIPFFTRTKFNILVT